MIILLLIIKKKLLLLFYVIERNEINIYEYFSINLLTRYNNKHQVKLTHNTVIETRYSNTQPVKLTQNRVM